MILPISLTIAAAAVLLHIWLSARVSQLRRQFRISIGDGDNLALKTRMRAHGNFAENMPIFLVLLALIEHAVGSDLWLWIAAMLFVLARLLHAFGMERPSPSRLRVVGIALSFLLLLGLSGYAVYLSYTDSANRRAIEAPAMHRA